MYQTAISSPARSRVPPRARGSWPDAKSWRTRYGEVTGRLATAQTDPFLPVANGRYGHPDPGAAAPTSTAGYDVSGRRTDQSRLGARSTTDVSPKLPIRRVAGGGSRTRRHAEAQSVHDQCPSLRKQFPAARHELQPALVALNRVREVDHWITRLARALLQALPRI